VLPIVQRLTITDGTGGGTGVDGGRVTVELPPGWQSLGTGAVSDRYIVQFTADVDSQLDAEFELEQRPATGVGVFLADPGRTNPRPTTLSGRPAWLMTDPEGWTTLVFADAGTAVSLRARGLDDDALVAFAPTLVRRAWGETSALTNGTNPTQTPVEERIQAQRMPLPAGCPVSLALVTTSENVEARAAEDDQRVGFVGLPPEGAAQSTPETGELVLYVQPEPTSRTWVYADGRLIWHRYSDRPEGANEVWTGFLEQRLTPEGVELLRAEVVSLGRPRDEPPSDHSLSDIRVLHEGRLVRLEPDRFTEIVARVEDPESRLPASAWEDKEIRAYVPSRYQVCLASRDLSQLPAPAQNLMSDAAHEERWVGTTEGTPEAPQSGQVRIYCADLATDEARALDGALVDAGIERDSEIDGYQGGPDPWSLTYRLDSGGYIGVEPYLPHGEVFCQHCDVRFSGQARP
jgi:hypothetical protein